MQDTKKLNDIIKSLYKIWIIRGCNVYHDTNWENVYQLLNIFNRVPGVTDVKCISNEYHNWNDLPYKDYNLEIETEYGQIEGYIRCCAAGNEEHPFDIYDIVVSFWKMDQTVNESNKEDYDYHFKNMCKDIRNAKGLNDLKRIAKKYVDELATIGLFLTTVYAFVSMPNSDYQELSEYTVAYTLTIEEGYWGDEEDIDYSNEIKKQDDWKLINDSVHATVYNAVPAQCKKDVTYTASMFKLDHNNVQAHKIIAMERTMMQKYDLHYGDIVKIEGTGKLDGIYQIQDTMNKRFAGQNKIDILVNQDIKYGQWYNVKLYKLINKDLANDIKDNMRDALNQKSVDARQQQYK